MKRLALLVLVFVAGAVLYAQPKIEIEGGNSHDWGKVHVKDSPLKTDVKIWNKGDKPLKIFEVKPTCGCTLAPLDKDSLQPGEYGTLKISLDINQNSGNVSKAIIIKSTDYNTREISYILKCYVEVPLSIFPRLLNFNSMIVGQNSIAKVVISNSTEKPIKLLSVKSLPADMKINIKDGDVIPAKGDLTVEASVLPKAVGRFTAKIEIKTDNLETSSLNIIGSGSIIEQSETMPDPEPATGNKTAPKK